MIQDLVNIIVTGSSYVLIAIGLTMVYGQLRILHVAHAAVYTLGAFAAWVIVRSGGDLWSGLFAAIVVAGIAGVAIYLFVYQSIVDRPPLVALIASVALLILAESLYQQNFFFGPDSLPFNPESSLPRIRLDWLRITAPQLAVIVVTLAVLIVIALIFRFTRIGLEWRALALDMRMANAVGIAVRRSMVLNFFLGSALAGIAGVLVGMYDGRVYATMGAVPSYKAFVVVVMGGLGNIPGAVVAGYVLALMESVIIANFGYLLPRDAIAFMILVLVLIFRPKGLFARGA